MFGGNVLAFTLGLLWSKAYSSRHFGYLPWCPVRKNLLCVPPPGSVGHTDHKQDICSTDEQSLIFHPVIELSIARTHVVHCNNSHTKNWKQDSYQNSQEIDIYYRVSSVHILDEKGIFFWYEIMWSDVRVISSVVSYCTPEIAWCRLYTHLHVKYKLYI